MSDEERGFTGWWIPAEWMELGLSPLECLLLAEIHALSRGPKGCIATDKHFAEHLGISVGGVSNIITRLRDRALIETVDFNGRYRTLKPIGVVMAFIRGLRQPSSADEGRVHRRMKQKDKEKGTMKKNTPTPHGETVPVPLLLNTEAFRKAWDDWCLHYRALGHKLTAISQERQLNKLTGWGEQRAIAAINHSIEKGYRGIYEENKNGTNQKHTAGGSKRSGFTPAPRGPTSYAGIGQIGQNR